MPKGRKELRGVTGANLQPNVPQGCSAREDDAYLSATADGIKQPTRDFYSDPRESITLNRASGFPGKIRVSVSSLQ